MTTPLRVLIVEDSEDDMALIAYALRRGGYDLTVERVETAAAMSAALDQQTWDIVIADHHMPHFSAPAALALLKDRGIDLPFIIVSGAIGEDIAVDALRAGAHDYIMKDRLARLVPAVERELHEVVERRKRKQAEEALRESEARFRMMADTAPVMIWMAGPDKFCQYFNKRWLDFTGRKIEQEQGYGWIEGVHPRDFQHCFDAYIAAFESRQDFSMEYRLRRADGEYRWLLETGVPRWMPDGSFAGYIGSCLDITERKLAEASLETHARQQAAVAELGRRALAGDDPASLLDEAARLLAELLAVEYSAIQELLPDGQALIMRAGVGWKAGVVGQATASATADSQAWYTLSSGAPVIVENLRAETRFRSTLLRDHSVISGVSVVIRGRAHTFGVLEAHTTRRREFADDDVHFLQAIAHVLATAIERRRTEQALQESQQRLAGIIGSAMDAIITTDADQRITLFNAAAAQMFRCPAAEALGAPLDRFIPERFRETHREYLHAFARSHKTRRTPHMLGMVVGLRADGEEFPIQAAISQTEAAGQKLYTVIMRDVTRLQRRERALAAITAISRAQRSAPARADLGSHILDQLESLIASDRAALGRRDPATGELVVEQARGAWASWAGARLPLDPAAADGTIAIERAGFDDRPGPGPRSPWLGPPAASAAMAEIPLICHEQNVGMLWVGRSAAIDESERQALTTIGDIAAGMIHYTTLSAQAERRLRGTNALRAIDVALAASLDLRLTLDVALDHLVEQLDVHAADVLVYNAQTQMLEYTAGRGFRIGHLQRLPVRLGEGLAGAAARDRRPIWVDDLRGEELARQLLPATVEGFVAYHAVPLIARGQLRGVIEIFHRAALAPDEEWLDFLEAVAAQAAVAIDDAEICERLRRCCDDPGLPYASSAEGWSHAQEL